MEVFQVSAPLVPTPPHPARHKCWTKVWMNSATTTNTNLITSCIYHLPTLPVVKPEAFAGFLPPGLHGDVKVTACGQHVGWHHTGSRCQFRQKVMEDHVTIPDQNLIISFQVNLHDLKEDIQPVSFML